MNMLIFQRFCCKEFFHITLQKLLRVIGYLFLKTPWQGAQTTIHCAVSEELEGVSGRYYGECQEQELVTAVAKDDDVVEELWRVSAKMVGLGEE